MIAVIITRRCGRNDCVRSLASGCPFQYPVDMNAADYETLSEAELDERIVYYSALVTEQRLARMVQVLSDRTRYITVVLENIYQPHNAAAVLRSCDAFGVQDVHVIENGNTFTPSPSVDMGTAQWLTIRRYRKKSGNTAAALAGLKTRGYRIAAMTPHAQDITLDQVDLNPGKTAFLFGTELDGLTDEALDSADLFVRIPMYGFVESFNISVSCALTLAAMRSRLNAEELETQLSELERKQLLCRWLAGSVKNPQIHEKRFP
jgi:tRNA (guanosine-2'-O-)-methyltransferase